MHHYRCPVDRQTNYYLPIIVDHGPRRQPFWRKKLLMNTLAKIFIQVECLKPLFIDVFVMKMNLLRLVFLTLF